MLTTVDNPFDPRTQFDEWYARDCNLARKGHYRDTVSLIALLANTSDLLSDEINDKIREDTIDDIIKYDFENKYKKIAI